MSQIRVSWKNIRSHTTILGLALKKYLMLGFYLCQPEFPHLKNKGVELDQEWGTSGLEAEGSPPLN